VRTRLDMILGAAAAIILVYTAVASVFSLLALDRWLGIRQGITLDLLLALVVVVCVVAWMAGCKLAQRLARDISASSADSTLYCHDSLQPPNLPEH
jgi:hypothetical protein